MSAKWFLRYAILSAMLLVDATANAQAPAIDPAKIAMAQRLFEQAMILMGGRKYVEACPKFEQVTQLVPMGLGGHEMLGQCYEAIGRLGSAWEEFTGAQSIAYAKADPKRAAALGKRARVLEPKVARIKIVVRPDMLAVEGLSISRDNMAQEKALWNSLVPVDSGDHVIEVIAPGREKWSKRVEVLADGAQIEIEIPPLLALRVIPPPSPPPSIVVVQRRTWQKPLGWTSLSTGAASLATTAILSGIAVNKRNMSDANGHCNEKHFCDSVGVSLREQALGLTNVATATTIFGSVLAAGGLFIVLTAPRTDDDGTTNNKLAKMRWNIEVSPVVVGVRGAW